MSTQDSCGSCSRVADIGQFTVGRGAFPAPRTAGLSRVTGGAVGGEVPQKTRRTIILACLVVVVIIIVVAVVYRRRRRGQKSGFYTLYAQEEPTRPWLAYTGTVPDNEWGTLPWALAVDDPSDKPHKWIGPPYTYYDL